MTLTWGLLMGLTVLYIYNYMDIHEDSKDITICDFFGAGSLVFTGCMMIPICLMMTCRLTNNVRLRRKYVDRSRKEESPLRSLYMMACCRPCAYGQIGEFVESNRVYSSNSSRQFQYAEM